MNDDKQDVSVAPEDLSLQGMAPEGPATDGAAPEGGSARDAAPAEPTSACATLNGDSSGGGPTAGDSWAGAFSDGMAAENPATGAAPEARLPGESSAHGDHRGLERGASTVMLFVRLLLTLAVLLFVAGLGYRAGTLVRTSPGGMHGNSSRLVSGFPRLRGNLARMIAMGAGTTDGDQRLGMNGEPFPGTLMAYWESANTILAHFYNPTPLSLFTPAGQAILADPQKLRTQLTYSAIQGVMSSLDDPYTRFLDPTAYKEMQQDNAGSFAGIGAQLVDKGGKIVILKPLPDTPAANAHIMPSDEIAAINGRSTEHMTSETAVQLIRGRPGTEVVLTLRRGSKLFTVKLVRAVIKSQHFESKIIDGDIGYMHLLMFDEQASDNIQNALQDFGRHRVKALILDLRDNPGGLLNAAVDVASKFIPAGTVVWVQERGGQRNSLPTNPDSHGLRSLPLVVLVNHYSASASEIVSGAIKDTHSGAIVGLTTWGKGLVQEVIPLNDGSAIALTTAHYFTPNGSDINLKGVSPDVVVGHNLQDPDTDSPEVIAKLIKERDAIDQQQLDAAVQILRRRIGPAPQAANAATGRQKTGVVVPAVRPPAPL